MTTKTAAQKAGVKPGTSIALLNPVPKVVESLRLPDDVEIVDISHAQLVFLFVNSKAELQSMMPPAVEALPSGAALWVFFRKGSRAAGLDMNRDDVWAIAERMDMRPLGLIGVDDTWAAFRLRPASRPIA